MKAKVQFVFEKLSETVYVPVEAVFDRPGGQVTYVATGDGFEERPVETGERNDKAVVITKGLKAGERVALSDPTRAEAG
jgi:multidrug efflux pump subunit AcrA (membrane-fusion protein)